MPGRAGRTPDGAPGGGPRVNRARLDAVRITATFVGPDADRAERVLAPPTGRRGWLYLGEQRGAPGLPRQLPLLDAGVELQLRRVPGAELSVAILRPCRRTRLSDRWLAFHLADGDELCIEADRTGERTSLTARMTSPRPAGARQAGRRLIHNVLSPRQAAFLADCADAMIEPAALRWLGPIELLTWQAVGWCGLDLNAERWTVPASGRDRLDVLMVSLRVEPQAAEVRRLGFETLLRRHGLDTTEAEPDVIRHVYQTLPAIRGPTT